LTTYALRRLLTLLPVMAVVGIVSFSIIRLTPGDPALFFVTADATPEEIDQVRARLGIDRPFVEQFVIWAAGVLRGDLGMSFYQRRPVTELFWSRFPPTLWLALSAQLLALLIAVPTGILSAVRPNSAWDRGLTVFTLFGVSVPGFWLALLLILLFSVNLRWLPVQGYVNPFDDPVAGLRHLVLPVVALGYSQAALIARMTRASMLEVLGQDYIRTARAKGVVPQGVVLKHALRNAMNPILTVTGLTVTSLISGSIIIEIVFNYPGVGRMIVDAVTRRDFPVIQGSMMIVAFMYVIVNLLVDISYSAFDPRIRYD
jgi:peptide/nickel transport system permease protein